MPEGGCGATGPNAEASRRRAQEGAGCGGRKRNGPTGAAAYGMPRNDHTPSASTPRTVPAPIVTVPSDNATSPGGTDGLAGRDAIGSAGPSHLVVRNHHLTLAPIVAKVNGCYR